jgi:hypothetical protein
MIRNFSLPSNNWLPFSSKYVILGSLKSLKKYPCNVKTFLSPVPFIFTLFSPVQTISGLITEHDVIKTEVKYPPPTRAAVEIGSSVFSKFFLFTFQIISKKKKKNNGIFEFF